MLIKWIFLFKRWTISEYNFNFNSHVLLETTIRQSVLHAGCRRQVHVLWRVSVYWRLFVFTAFMYCRRHKELRPISASLPSLEPRR